MTEDMGYDLKLPQVGELTLPQWQDWLVRYNAVLGDRERRIQKLEAALDMYRCNCVNGIDESVREVLEGKDD
jgi:hypothetical protein